MVPNQAIRLVESSPIAASGEFGISQNDTAHIMGILRDQLYSDKILAVIREYSSNAWDAHRDNNKADVPIKVTLPTAMEPTLTIRDYGKGLSSEEIFKIYTQYGASTKRGSDISVGMLGIGSKSGFAYSDSFTITAFNGGMKRVYIAVLDESQKGVINQLYEETCGSETGIEIQIAVRPTDIDEFEQKACELFQYFEPRPEINAVLPAPMEAKARLKHGVIHEEENYYARTPWRAVMGCVSYTVSLDQLGNMQNTPEGGIADFLQKLSGALYFDIGEVEVSASREELKYSDKTKVALVKKFNRLVEEYMLHTLTELETGGYGPWEKRLRAQVIVRLHLPVPAGTKDLFTSSVAIVNEDEEELDPKKIPLRTYVITKESTSAPTKRISIDRDVSLVLYDDKRALRGFSNIHQAYFVRAVTHKGDLKVTIKTDWAAIQLEVEALCKRVGITGIPIKKLSELPWTAPYRGAGRRPNKKHRMKVFAFNPEEPYHAPWSDCWEVQEHEPSKDDVFCVIEKFQTTEYELGSYYREDQMLAQLFGGEMPTVYGYKTCKKKPIEAKDCIGTEYREWRRKFVEAMLTPELTKTLDQFQWTNALDESENMYWQHREASDKRDYETLVENLGEDHRISKLSKRQLDARAFFKDNNQINQGMRALHQRLPSVKLVSPEATKENAAILRKYPLLSIVDGGLGLLWSAHAKEWAKYIHIIDNS